MKPKLLVRYGAVPEVSRFTHELSAVPVRNDRVVVLTHRGVEIGTVLEALRSQPTWETSAGGNSADDADEATAPTVLRRATPADEIRHIELSREAQQSFGEWQARISDWKIELELVDLEWTLDRQKLVLYVLGGRGPETTKLALQAAAAGLAVIEVQPIDANGPIPLPAAGGCGTGGCGCHESDHDS
ncbi:MAG: hypothetical protein JSS02_24085 [Planctomycetes bacterium]|nr:hypothetical protein [Planctomycetota bacterium]